MLQENLFSILILLLSISINLLVLSANCLGNVFIADTTFWFVKYITILEKRKQATPIILDHFSDRFIIFYAISVTCCLAVKAISVKLT